MKELPRGRSLNSFYGFQNYIREFDTLKQSLNGGIDARVS